MFMLGKKLFVTAAAGMLIAAAGTAGAAANFDNDVAASIDKGLAWFDVAGCYGGTNGATFNCGDATGLALLALLEKRPSADGDPQGYAGASAADQTRMRLTVGEVIRRISSEGTTFAAYRDGGYMMALSVYMRSGGPEITGAPLTLKAALDKVFDRSIVAQQTGAVDAAAPWPASNGYWYYTDVGTSAQSCPGCYRDSSTTQLVVAGLASARSTYLTTFYADAARLTQLNAATALARTAYERNGTPGGACTSVVPANELGHGYNAGDSNSIQQTASGLWIQLVGGGKLNDASVQGYLRWLQNRYRWDDISVGGVDAGWGSSTWYYLWSSFKAFQFMVDANETPTAGNIGVADIGTLPPASDPACGARQVHRDPTSLPRIPLFGAGGNGYYDETPRIYFDYAYSIMGHQCAVGQTPDEYYYGGSSPGGFYGCNGSPGRWDGYAEQAYALLVLQRSVGGGCILDSEGKCPALPPPVPPTPTGRVCENPNDSDAVINRRDLTAIVAIMGGSIRNPPVKATAATAWADFNKDGWISRADSDGCTRLMDGAS
jgi:hypothetical protein